MDLFECAQKGFLQPKSKDDACCYIPYDRYRKLAFATADWIIMTAVTSQRKLDLTITSLRVTG